MKQSTPDLEKDLLLIRRVLTAMLLLLIFLIAIGMGLFLLSFVIHVQEYGSEEMKAVILQPTEIIGVYLLIILVSINFFSLHFFGAVDFIISIILFSARRYKRAVVSGILGLFSFFLVLYWRPPLEIDFLYTAFTLVNLFWIIAVSFKLNVLQILHL